MSRRVITHVEIEGLWAAVPQILTARYGNKALLEHPGAKVRITAGRPPRVPYELAGEIRGLAPAWTYMKDPEPVFRAKYRTDLERRGGAIHFARRFVQMAQDAGVSQLVLLCFEDLRKPGLWCHRTLFAEWWQQETGQIVVELPEPPIRIIEGKDLSETGPSPLLKPEQL